jgi:uncharacterized protein (DUF302 family)
MNKPGSLLLAALLFSSPLYAGDNYVSKKSSNSVTISMDRLENALKQRGVGILARVDHAGAAQKADMTLRPTQVLIFGSPKLGTPLMQSNQQIGLDLPLKVLAWEDNKGQTWLTYEKPGEMGERHGVKEPAEVLKKMAGVLDAVTSEAAAGPEK